MAIAIHIPPPTCEEEVIEKIRKRREAGLKKYGTSMERTDLTDLEWLQHAQDEAMDCAIYLQKLIRLRTEIERTQETKTQEKLK